MRFKMPATLMSEKCELNQRATNTSSISIIMPVVPFFWKTSKQTHTETQSHVHTHTEQTVRTDLTRYHVCTSSTADSQ